MSEPPENLTQLFNSQNNNSNDNNNKDNSHPDEEHVFSKYLSMKLGFILLGIILGILLSLIFTYLLYRRYRRQSGLLKSKGSANKNNDSDDIVDVDDDGFISISKSEYTPLTQFTKHQTSDPYLKTDKLKSQLFMMQNLSQDKTKIFSIENESFDNNTDNEVNDYAYINNSGYPTRRRLANYVKPNVIQSTQQYVESAELKRKTETLCHLDTSHNDQEKPGSQLAVEMTRKTIRRSSSTPNMMNLMNPPKLLEAEINHTFDSLGCIADPPLDDSELFKIGENDDSYADITLIDSTEDVNDDNNGENNNNNTNDANQLSQNLNTHIPLIPINLPQWATERGIPERGYITFTVQIEGDLQNIRSSAYLCVRIFDVRCALSRNFEPKAGKFYVKVRLQPINYNNNDKNSVSLLSLDQISMKSLKTLSDKMDILSVKRKSTVTTGRTPVKRAYRSPVFRHKIRLHLPADIVECINNSSPTVFNQSMESITSSHSLEYFGVEKYELKIDLKERSACKTNDLHGTSTVQYLPHWKSSQLVGTVRLPLTPKMWQYLSEDPTDHRRSTVIDMTAAKVKEEGKCSPEILPNKTLWFVKCLQVPDENAISRGEITFGMQYNPDNGSLTISLFNCAAMNLPKGTN
ncbi:unnamed protein product [Trichobilharzia szidati]|nr:unnamed protein product [Trichobilharzia szidati]